MIVHDNFGIATVGFFEHVAFIVFIDGAISIKVTFAVFGWGFDEESIVDQFVIHNQVWFGTVDQVVSLQATVAGTDFRNFFHALVKDHFGQVWIPFDHHS